MQIQNPDLIRICPDVLFSVPEHVSLCTYRCGHSKKRWDIYSFPSMVYSIEDVFQPEPASTLETLSNSSQEENSEDLIIDSVMMVFFNMRRVNFNISVARKPPVFPKMQELLPLIGRQLQKVTAGVWIDNISKSWVEGEAEEWLIAVHQVTRWAWAGSRVNVVGLQENRGVCWAAEKDSWTAAMFSFF